jgi:hypothetical protein
MGVGLSIGMGIGGALIGGISSVMQGRQTAADIRASARDRWEEYLIKQQYADEMYGIGKNAAFSQLDTQEGILKEDLNTGIGNYNLFTSDWAYQNQSAMIDLYGNIGNLNSQQAVSGVKNSNASGLQSAYAETAYERNRELQQAQNNTSLQGMVTQAERTQKALDWERDSWISGQKYQSKESEDKMNLSLALLGQKSLERAASSAEPSFFDGLMGIFQGASTGLGLSNSINTALQFSDHSKEKSYSFSLPESSYDLSLPVQTDLGSFGNFNTIMNWLGQQPQSFNNIGYGTIQSQPVQSGMFGSFGARRL